MWRKYLPALVIVAGCLSGCYLLLELLHPHQLSIQQADTVAIIHHQRDLKHHVLSHCLAKNNTNATKFIHRDTHAVDKIDNVQHSQYQGSPSCSAGFVPSDKGDCIPCKEGMFSLPQWILCLPLLTCEEILHDIQVSELLYTIVDWKLHSAKWDSYDVIYATSSKRDDKASDFQRLSPHENILCPIGFCNKIIFKVTLVSVYALTETFLGSALELDSILSRQTGCDNWIVRFHLAIDYVRILTHLHSDTLNSDGPHVMCNSHTLKLLLSQLFITEEFRLIFVPTDNLPSVTRKREEINNGLVKCSMKELKGDFIAPEQKWPFQNLKVFNYRQQPGYDEKTDIWKIPNVVESFLGVQGKHVLDYLFVIHQRCKHIDPHSRPTAGQVLEEYTSVWNLLV